MTERNLKWSIGDQRVPVVFKLCSSRVQVVFQLCSSRVQVVSNMKNIVKTLLFSLVILDAASIASGLTCRGSECIDQAGVTCGDDGCVCPECLVGDAQVACVDPDYSCICTLTGDQHVTDFRGQRFFNPLPCQFDIFVTDTGKGLKMHAEIPTKLLDGSSDSPASYNEGFYYDLKTDNIHVKSSLAQGREPDLYQAVGNTYKQIAPADYGLYGASVEKPSSDTISMNFNRLNITIKQRDITESFALVIPSNMKSSGMCGECQGTDVETFTPAMALKQTVAALGTSQRSEVCYNLQKDSKACTKTDLALDFCGPILTDPKVTKCITDKVGTYKKVLEKFSECLKKTCNSQLFCGDHAFFSGCARASHIKKFEAKPGFCSWCEKCVCTCP